MATRTVTVEGKALLDKVRKTNQFASKADADRYFASLPPLPYGSGEEPSLRLTDEEKQRLAESPEK